MELDPEQRKAVEHGEGPLLIIAGPGSGKTGVITRRILHLLETVPGLRPENILALTYTDKAASEMKARISRSLPGLGSGPSSGREPSGGGPHISTFHSYCYQVLRERGFERRLLDQTDVWIFLRQRIEQLELDFYQKLAEPGAFLHDLNNFFSRCQDELVEPERFEAYVGEAERRFLARAPSLDPAEREFEEQNVRKLREVARVFRKSRELLQAAGRTSFGSLFSETLALWNSEPDSLDRQRARYLFILVDEFQDTNYAQIEILKRLAVRPSNLTAVGDDDQAIYRFRGASSGAFQLFREAFPRRTELFLFRNYRSTRRILRAASVLIRRNDRALGEKPALHTSNPEGPRIILLQSADAASEAAWIAEEISRLLGRGTTGSEIAALYRAHAYRDRLVEELGRREIPFSIRGLSVLASSVLRDLVAYLQLLHSPHENVSLTRVLLAPRWKFPEELAMAAREEASRRHCSLFAAVESFDEGSGASGVARQLTGWRELKGLLEKLRRKSEREQMTKLFDALVSGLGLTFLPGEEEGVYLETFRKFLEEWEEKSETRKFREFMEYFNYFVEAGGRIERPSPADPAAVQLMSVHAAKGLEFFVVFILSVSPQRFPHREQKPLIEFPDDLRNAPAPAKGIHLQEERRLLYVAMTRAKERLYISSVSKSAKKRSIFIEDLLSDPAVRAKDIEEISVPPLEAAGSREPARSRKSRKDGRDLFRGTPHPETFHPDLAGWAARPAVLALDGKLELSATAVEDYLTCPLKYKFGHLLKIPTGPQAALTFGSVMHRSVRRYFELRRTHLPTFEEIKEYFEDVWKSAGYEDKYQEETYRKTGLEQLREFIARQNAQPLEAREIQFEKGFRWDLDDIAVEGRIDQINPLGDHPFVPRPTDQGLREVELVDYKTGKPRPPSEADKSLQLSVYALAARREMGLEPVRLSLYYLTNNQVVSTVRSAKQLDAAVEKIREVADQIRAQRFEPSPGFACKWCDYVPICPAHEENF